MRRSTLHPVLFAIYPALFLFSNNLSLFAPADLISPLLVASVGSILVWTLASALLRDAARGGLIATAFVILFFGYGTFQTKASSFLLGQGIAPQQVVWVYLFLGLLVLAICCRQWKHAKELNQILNVVALVLVAMPLAVTIRGVLAVRHKVSQVQPTNTKPSSNSHPPDIFYIILDGYGRQDSLKRTFDFDNSAFIRALEQRGFYVAKQARSNYSQTQQSLASSLNLNYLSDLPLARPSYPADRDPLNEIIDQNAVSKFLRKQGYVYNAITSGFPNLHFHSADMVYHEPLRGSLFASALLEETPLSLRANDMIGALDNRRSNLNGAFDNLEKLAKPSLRPRFVFAHILAPHPPFVFHADGSPRKPHSSPVFYDGSHFFEHGGTEEDYRTGYPDQIQYVNKRVLQAVDALRDMHPRPIIILQGDHGSKLHLNQSDPSKTDTNECFSNLNALLVPPEIRAELYTSLTPVNTFRLIIDKLFKESLPKLPDRSYLSSWDKPYEYIEISAR